MTYLHAYIIHHYGPMASAERERERGYFATNDKGPWQRNVVLILLFLFVYLIFLANVSIVTRKEWKKEIRSNMQNHPRTALLDIVKKIILPYPIFGASIHIRFTPNEGPKDLVN